jgi:hypothetical protein
MGNQAPVAQLDRVPGFEPGGREFESLRARHYPWVYTGLMVNALSGANGWGAGKHQ